MWFFLDLIDRRLVFELSANCRATYRALAKSLNLSPNAIKNRIANLVERGVILRFTVGLTPIMMDAEDIIAIVFTDGTENSDILISRIGRIPCVFNVAPLINPQGGSYLINGLCTSPAMIAELGSTLRTQKEVQSVEMHREYWDESLSLSQISYPAMMKLSPDRVKKIEFTKSQIQVLSCLVEDARMPIKDISSRTGMTPKTVRRILNQLEPGKGILYYPRLNFTVGGFVDAWVRMRWDNKKSSLRALSQWLQSQFPDELLALFISSSDAVIFADLLVDSIEDVYSISNQIRNAAFIKSTTTLVASASYAFDRLTEVELRKIVENPKTEI